MSVKLRLVRMGKKKQPTYRVIAADARSPRDGRFIEILGTYNPLTEPARIKLETERVRYWIKSGAQPTATVRNILKNEGVLAAAAETPAE